MYQLNSLIVFIVYVSKNNRPQLDIFPLSTNATQDNTHHPAKLQRTFQNPTTTLIPKRQQTSIAIAKIGLISNRQTTRERPSAAAAAAAGAHG